MRSPSMRIGISRISQTPQQSYEVLAAAQRHGFQGVQLKPTQYGEFLDSPSAFQQHYDQLARLACGGLIVYPGGNPAEWLTKAETILPFASALSAEHICFCSNVYGTGATEEQVTDVAQALTAIGQRARQENLVISIHNHVGSLVETEEDIARLLEKLDPQICGLTLDTAHAAKAGILQVERLVTRFHQHLINVHLKDLDPQGKFCALGQGTLPLQPILDTLTNIHYNQWLIVDEETASLPTEEAFSIAANYLKSQKIMD